MRENLSWLFFDLDGTLADSVEAIYQAYLAFMVKLGLKGSEEEFEALNGPSLSEIVAILSRKHGLDEHRAPDLLDTLRQCVKEAYENRVTPVNGAEAVLAELCERGYRLALVTSGEKEVADVFLRPRNWDGFFSAYVFGDEVAKAKPAGDIYLHALEKVGAQAAQVLVVEDSLNGARAARAAGLDMILIQNDRPHDEDVGVVATISRLDEILEIL